MFEFITGAVTKEATKKVIEDVSFIVNIFPHNATWVNFHFGCSILTCV